MIKLAFMLFGVTSAVCAGFVSHPFLFILTLLVAYILMDSRVKKLERVAIGLWACIFLIVGAFPASCAARHAANAMYGAQEVENEFIRLEGSESYVKGKEEAINSYSKASEYAKIEQSLRQQGMCNKKFVTHSKPHYRLVCADGWGGSSCGCGGGRGCCSWHGGYGYCDTYNAEETRMLIDDMSVSSSDGYYRARACGWDRSSLRAEYTKLAREVDDGTGDAKNLHDKYAWLLGWRDGSSKFPDFENVVMKDDSSTQ